MNHGAEIDIGDMGSGGTHTSTSCAAPAHPDNHKLIVVPHCASLNNRILEGFQHVADLLHLSFPAAGAKLHCRMLGSAVMAQVAVVNNQREGVV